MWFLKNKTKGKNTKSNVRVGGAKKKRFSTPVVVLVAVCAVAVLTVGGYYGYSKYRLHKLEASAASWTDYGWRNNSRILACYAGSWGSVAEVRYMVWKQAANGTLVEARASDGHIKSSTSWLFNFVLGGETYIQQGGSRYANIYVYRNPRSGGLAHEQKIYLYGLAHC